MIPATAYLWNQNARWTVWDLEAYRARHPMPWKPAAVPAPVKPPDPVPTKPAAPRVDDAKLPGVTVDTTVVFDSDKTPRKAEESTAAGGLIEYLKRKCEKHEQNETEIFSILRRVGIEPTGRGIVGEVEALAQAYTNLQTMRSSTAPSTQHEPGETAHDNSAAQTAATAG